MFLKNELGASHMLQFVVLTSPRAECLGKEYARRQRADR